MSDRPKVGVGVLLVRPDGKFLIGKRLAPHGRGEFAVPGGHLEYGESFEECAAREVVEETGIALPLASLSFAHAVNSVFPTGQHYVTIFMKALVGTDATAVNLEPDKCAGWEWCIPADTPSPRFMPLTKLLSANPSVLQSS